MSSSILCYALYIEVGAGKRTRAEGKTVQGESRARTLGQLVCIFVVCGMCHLSLSLSTSLYTNVNIQLDVESSLAHFALLSDSHASRAPRKGIYQPEHSVHISKSERVRRISGVEGSEGV